MKNILFLLLLLFSNLQAQKDKHPDTIYCLTMGNMVVFIDSDSWLGDVSLISMNYKFTNKKPDIVYLDIDSSGWVWSYIPDIVPNGEETLLVYTSDIIDEKTIKKRKGRIYVTYSNFNYPMYREEKPNDKKLQRAMDKYLKSYNRRQKKKDKK